MLIYRGLFFILLCHAFSASVAQDYATFFPDSLELNNGTVSRAIKFKDGAITTRRITVKSDSMDFTGRKSKEFSLLINGKYYDGHSGWTLMAMANTHDDHQGKGAVIKLGGKKELAGLEIELSYLLYPDLPVIRKQIKFTNKAAKEFRIESLDIELLQIGFSYVESVTYANYGRQKHLSTYIGNWDDPLVAVHNYSLNAGILLGNESPGVLKRTAYNTGYNNVEIGLTHNRDDYPFRKYIKSGASWNSPRIFIIPYVNRSDPWKVMNGALADYLRRHMGLRINEIAKRPDVMYNNYVPFYDQFNDTLLLQLAETAAETGITQFEIDCGWYVAKDNIGKNEDWMVNTGDWIVDKKKFPNGLKPVFNRIKALGMEPGLWISVGSAAGKSAVFQQHPEWAIRNEKGKTVDRHNPFVLDLNTMCFGTNWKGYIKKKILDLVKDDGLGFVKLDLSVVTSAYITDTKQAGCSAKDHPYHKDREESLMVMYERLFELFDELHAAAPNLYIDCTFETAGKLQLVDYAFLQHAEGNWLTNIQQPFPVSAFRLRNLTWWKSPVIPASTFIVGNLEMDSKEFIQELKSLIGSFPVVLGDLRKLTPERKGEIRAWTDWIKLMKKKYNYDLYRQDLPALGEPTDGAWDGWSRINTDTKSGGIIGIFKQGSLDNERTISIPGLAKDQRYDIIASPGIQVIATLTGRELEEQGFKVQLPDKYDARLFEIARSGN